MRIQKEQPRKRLTLTDLKIHPVQPRLNGWFFYVGLLTKREYECKQRQNECRKCDYVFKIKVVIPSISHRHHPSYKPADVI